ncbi:MAG TPA: MoxR family ATPase [Candidatus Desulfovibrio intestinipullorum]|uniref:MoxR family ATPase n=1 Tax=Candidatus Desulfovibrio intestinipullorum TaxID=2838536 RepID=A0A9D1TQ63_9BACT|nr:MoxR family ATPase [Candidatus Desulfovibrio intestinipullorum]
MGPRQIVLALHTLISIHQPVFLWGAPGVGKSQVVAQVAAERGMVLRDIRAVLLDPVDLRGLPRISPTGTAVWCPPAFLPDASDTSQGILFLDELNAAPPLVQAACYQLILDRAIGEYRLPDGWTIIAAGNRDKDRAVTHRMPTALANRMVHLDFEALLEDWLAWAREQGIRREVRAFLRFRPKFLHLMDPASQDRAFPSPRSWEFVSRILEAEPAPEVEYDLIRGTVGQVAAAEFTGYLSVWKDLPDVEHVLADPCGTAVPAEPAALYALCEALGLLASADTIEALADYALRLPAEFGVLLMRDCVLHDTALAGSAAFARWAESNAEVLL